MARAWLVTGASRGIGEAIARLAAAEGARLALVARSEAVERIAAELGAVAIRADLSVDGEPERVAAEAAERLGGLDVIVNNAGIHRGGRIEKLAEDDFESVLKLNLVVPFRLVRAASPQLGDGGAIVNIGAVVGLRGFPGDAPYGAAKAGLWGLTQVLALEFARRKITVNYIAPGFTETELTAAVPKRGRELILSGIPLRRTASPEEVARVVCFVAAQPYMTGAMVPIEGGLLATFGAQR